MPNEKQDLMNHRQTALACKNYTDKEIKASEERILSIVARNNVDFIDHTDEATYRFTAPANAKLLMLQSIAGNSVKYSPSVASDNNATHIKTLPSTVYDLDVSKVDGVGYKVNQLFNHSIGFSAQNATIDTSTNEISMLATAENGQIIHPISLGSATGHKFFSICEMKFPANYQIQFWGGTSNNSEAQLILGTGSYKTYSLIFTNQYGYWLVRDTTSSNWQEIKIKKDSIKIFDLTLMGINTTDVSVATSELLKRGIDINTYVPYNTGFIRNNAFTGATVEGANLYSGEQNKTITVNNTLYSAFKLLDNFKSGTTYTLSFDYKQVSGDTNSYYLTLGYGNTGYTIDANIGIIALSNGRLTTTFTPNNTNYSNLYIRIPRYTSAFSGVFSLDNIMLNEGNSALPYQPHTSQTIAIDLTTIKDSNNVSLFPSGKMMGTNNADFITPYNQESRWNEYTFTGNESVSARTVAEGYNGYTINEVLDYKVHTTNFVSNLGLESRTNVYSISGIELDTNKMYITFPTSQGIDTTAKCIAFLTGKTMQYERATYLTSNTDLTTLTKINAQSNGTITLNNTDNVDMPNLISYNAIIRHSLATAVKYESFNKFDKTTAIDGEWITNTGATLSGSGNSHSDYISILPSTTYYFKNVIGSNNFYSAIWYDENKNFISYSVIGGGTSVSGTLTSPNNAYYVIANFKTDYKDSICINISNQDLNGTYKPYKAPITRLLPNSEAKYSWGITDGVRNTRVFCDDECNPVNEGQLDVDNVDLGSFTYTRTTSYNNPFFYCSIAGLKINGNAMANIYNKINNSSAGTFGQDSNDLDFCIGNSTNQIFIRNDSYDNATAFGTAMSGEMLKYEKATTDIETLDDFDFSFDCEEGDTFTIIGCELLQCYATYSFLIKEAKSNE